MPRAKFHKRRNPETGEIAWAKGADLYSDWELIETADRMPGPHEDMVDGAWRVDAEAMDAALHAQIEAEAGAFRSRFITVSPGKELTYMRKELDARDCLTGGAGPWPMLDQEAAVRGVTVEELAATIVAKADAWQMIGGAIEAATVGAKAAVLAAETAEEKRAAAAVDWEGLVARPDEEGSSE